MPIVVNGTTLTDIYVGNTKLTRVQVRENENSIFVVVFEQGGVVKVAYIYAGNWKMNKLKADIDSFFTDFNANLNQNSNKEVIILSPASVYKSSNGTSIDIVVFIPFTSSLAISIISSIELLYSSLV